MFSGQGRTAAIVGVGETAYYKRGGAPVAEFVLACEAILRAADDAGISVSEIDGFTSYSNDRNDPVRLATALGLPALHHASMVWGGGGGGVCAAVANAAAAVVTGQACYVAVFRSLAQGQFGRFGEGPPVPSVSGPMAHSIPYGIMSPAQAIALRTCRFLYELGLNEEPLAAVALAAYAHAQANPRAVMYGHPLTWEQYFDSRYIAEPFRLYDCCLENDGGAAVIVTTTDRAADLRQPPAHVLAAVQGSTGGHDLFTHTSDPYAAANFDHVAPRLYEMAGIGPKDVDVAQIYENFTGAVVMSMVEHGLCARDEVAEFFRPGHLTIGPDARLPINTSGGNLAECYMHGLELVIEAARQIRGQSTSQVDGARIALVAGGPVAAPASSLLLGRDGL